MDALAHPGCLVHVHLVGIITAEQTEDGKTEANDRLMGVAVHSYQHEDLATIDDVRSTLLSQVEAFFISYNRQRGMKVKVTGTGGPKKAIGFLKAGIEERKREKES
jgi:inorganic pyrophosphatase